MRQLISTTALALVLGAVAFAATAQAPATPAPAGPGCVTAPDQPFVAPPEPPAGKGIVVFYRLTEGSATPLRVISGQTKFCALARDTYFWIESAPGLGLFSTENAPVSLGVQIKAGKTVYAEVRAVASLNAPTVYTGRESRFNANSARFTRAQP